MGNRMIVLISFVLILSLCDEVSARDLNPPNFAGGSQTGVVVWEFDEDNDQPASFKYRPRPRDEDERFGFRYYDDSWQWQEGGYLTMAGGEESLVMPLPAGEGANLRGYMQVVWEGQLEDPPLGVAPGYAVVQAMFKSGESCASFIGIDGRSGCRLECAGVCEVPHP